MTRPTSMRSKKGMKNVQLQIGFGGYNKQMKHNYRGLGWGVWAEGPGLGGLGWGTWAKRPGPGAWAGRPGLGGLGWGALARGPGLRGLGQEASARGPGPGGLGRGAWARGLWMDVRMYGWTDGRMDGRTKYPLWGRCPKKDYDFFLRR